MPSEVVVSDWVLSMWDEEIESAPKRFSNKQSRDLAGWAFSMKSRRQKSFTLGMTTALRSRKICVGISLFPRSLFKMT